MPHAAEHGLEGCQQQCRQQGKDIVGNRVEQLARTCCTAMHQATASSGVWKATCVTGAV